MHYDVSHLASDATEGWVRHPLSPSEGDPDAKVLFLRQTGSQGGSHLSGVFTAQPSVVPSTIAMDETLILLEGEVRIEIDDGQVIDARVGEMVFLAAGTKLTWHYLMPFKEMFFGTTYERDA
jgi:uncharacterized cupin superfamily protein